MLKMRKIIAFVMALMLLAGMAVFSAAATEPPTEPQEEQSEALPEEPIDERSEDPEALPEEQLDEEQDGQPMTAADQTGTITVSLRIEGVVDMIYYNKAIEIEAGATVEDLMVKAAEIDETLGIVITGSSFGGTYIPEIAGLAESEYGGISGWSYIISGFSPTMGQSFTYLEDGDDVVYYYGDPWGDAGMQYPIPDLSKLYTSGAICFMSEDTEWDDDYNEIKSLNPVAGAAVTFNGVTYITDENGEITVANTPGIAGMRSLQIERYDEASGLPTVLRFAPDYEMFVPFADVPDGEWFDYPVEYCAREGYFTGVGNNMFAPLNQMSIAQLVTVLARIAGIDPDLMTGNMWYEVPVKWAIETEVLTVDGKYVFDSEEWLDADIADFYEYALTTNVTREMFIYMFYLTADIVGTYDMTVRADITGAADYEDINEDYREAVSWAVASNIIRGTGGAALTISPRFEVNRATVCQMLLNYFSN